MGHDPKLVEALRLIRAKLEATPEPLRGPFLVKGLAPYVPPAHPMNPVSVGDDLVERIEVVARNVERHANKQNCWPGDNDFEDAASALREAAARIIAVEAERDKLRQIISDCAKALTNGAFIAPSASVEFMALLPSEIAAAWATQPSPQEPS